jgi:hypothetical protein
MNEKSASTIYAISIAEAKVGLTSLRVVGRVLTRRELINAAPYSPKNPFPFLCLRAVCVTFFARLAGLLESIMEECGV